MFLIIPYLYQRNTKINQPGFVDAEQVYLAEQQALLRKKYEKKKILTNLRAVLRKIFI